jgi:hypothetical protein
MLLAQRLQALFLTNNVTFIAINGLVGLALAPVGWMATVPITGYVAGGALATAGGAAPGAAGGGSAPSSSGLLVAMGSSPACAPGRP